MKGAANTKANSIQFGYAFKKLLVTSIFSVNYGTNCESDFADVLLAVGQPVTSEENLSENTL